MARIATVFGQTVTAAAGVADDVYTMLWNEYANTHSFYCTNGQVAAAALKRIQWTGTTTIEKKEG